MVVIVSNCMRHPLFVSFLQWEPWTASYAQDNRQEDQPMQSARNDEGEPHAEVVNLKNLRASERENTNTNEFCYGNAREDLYSTN